VCGARSVDQLLTGRSTILAPAILLYAHRDGARFRILGAVVRGHCLAHRRRIGPSANDGLAKTGRALAYAAITTDRTVTRKRVVGVGAASRFSARHSPTQVVARKAAAARWGKTK